MHTVAPISLSHFPATWGSIPRVLDSHETELIECRDAGTGDAYAGMPLTSLIFGRSFPIPTFLPSGIPVLVQQKMGESPWSHS